MKDRITGSYDGLCHSLLCNTLFVRACAESASLSARSAINKRIVVPSLFLLRELKTTTWCQERDYTVSAFAEANSEIRSVFCPRSTRSNTTFPTPQEDNIAELAGLPTPRMDWSSTDAPQALKKFKNLCELYFSGPLKDKSEEEQVSYLLIWSGEEGIELGVHVDANS